MKFSRIAVLCGVMTMSFIIAAHAQKPDAISDLPTVKICTGAVDGNYHFSGSQILTQARGVLNVVLVPTAGSMENLDKLDAGACDATIAQSDALGVWRAKNSSSSLNIEVSTVLYMETVHLICNSSAKLSKITGLTKDMTVLTGPNGSGSQVTWASFILADPKTYADVPTLPIGGVRAANKVKQGDDATCMLFVSGLKANSINEANVIAQTVPGRMVLVPTNDSDLLKLRTPGKKGSLVYKEAVIPDGTYKGGLQPSSSWGSNSVDTVSVDAIFVANSKFIDAHPSEYDTLLRSVTRALPAIKNRVEPK